MPADSLVNMSLRACSKITKRITDIGGIPYSVSRPFLLKIDNPEQLHALELKCEQIVGHDAEIWLALIKRDIPNWETKKHEPRDPKNWWKVYRKLKKDSMLEMDAGADKLKAALNDKNEKQLAEIKPMKAMVTSRGQSLQSRVSYGYQSRKTGSRASSKLSLMDKIKKEARDARHARAIVEQQQRKKMATTVTRAPAQFVADVRTQRQKLQQSPERPVRVQHPLSTVASSSRPALTHQQTQDREGRLGSLTSGKSLQVSSAQGALPKDKSQRETITVSVEIPSTPVAEPETLTPSFLEEASPPTARKILRDALEKPEFGNGNRSASPQIATIIRKRKKEPDLFMAPVKRKIVAAGSHTALR